MALPAPDDLHGVLACSWTATPTGPHRLVPDGCIDVLWLSSDQVWVCGPETTAWTFSLDPGTEAVGVRFRPGMAPAALGFDASSLRDRRASLDRFVARPVANELLCELSRAGDQLSRVRNLEAFVRNVAGNPNELDPFAAQTLTHLAQNPRANAGELSELVGITCRQLHRRALRSFGYGTSTLARLLRFQRFLAHTELKPGVTIAQLCVEAGFSDQAHLARDCRAITGETPRAFLRTYQATFPDMSDPYKTSPSFVRNMAS